MNATAVGRIREGVLERRAVLGTAMLGATTSATLGCAPIDPVADGTSEPLPLAVVHTDVLVVGGGVGGTAAALAVLRDHHKVVLTEATAWVGGQLTSQGVPPDEHVWIEDGLGATATYRELRERVRDHVVQYFPVTAQAERAERLDPGRSWVSLLAAEPRVWHAVLRSMLAPYEETGRLRLLTKATPIEADARNGTVRSVTLQTERRRIRVHAKYVIDATELGDLLPLVGTPYVVGREAGRGPNGTHEPHNDTDRPEPHVQQHFTVVGAVGKAAGREGVPAECRLYDRFKPSYAEFPTKSRIFDPTKDWSWDDAHNYWQYRRVRFHGYLTDAFLGDITLLNQPQNDCHERVLIPPSGPTKAGMFEAGVRLAAEKTRGLVRYFQNDYPRPNDDGIGWGGLFLVPDVFGTDDGLARYPYIREARRIRAELTIREQDVAAGTFDDRTSQATEYPDSVGVGIGPIDIHVHHPTPSGLLLPTHPFQIPLRALLPRRMHNLLAGAKNIGTTHITNGCYRYHPVEWGIGEAAGHACAFALRQKVKLRSLVNNRTAFDEFAAYLDGRGVQRSWSADHARVEVQTFHSA